MSKSVENLAKRKATGGRRKPYRGRRVCEKDSYAVETVMGERRLLTRRMIGGGVKTALRKAGYVNVSDDSTGKTTRAKILRVLSNPANRDYERRRVITKGALIETEAGVARVVSRPGQEGVLNAVLKK